MVDKFFKFLFALVAASIAAALSGSLALIIGAFLYSAMPAANGFPGIQILDIAPAFFVLGLFAFAPLQTVLAWRGKSGRIAHIVAATVVLFVLVLLLGQGLDTREPPPLFDQLTSLAPALPLVLFAALVSGRTFTGVMNSPQKLELWLVAPLLIWFAALYVVAQGHVTPSVSGAGWSYNPEFAREPIRGAWFRYGGNMLLLLGGVGAFLVCLRPRLSLAFFAAAIAMPLSFGVWFRLTPVGPINPSFTLGDRTFSLDWRLEPRLSGKDEFSFIAEKSGPWRIGRPPGNTSITISTDLAWLDRLDEGYSWERGPYEKQGLSCRDGRFERRPYDLAVVCEAKAADGHVLSHVMCELGYCSHHFRSGDLHYWLHYARDDFPKWGAFETETVTYVDRAARGELRDVLKGRTCSISYHCPEDAWLDSPAQAKSEAPHQ
jgi:hypothetical protein